MKIIDEMRAWTARPVGEVAGRDHQVYAALFIDAIVMRIRDGQVANLTTAT